MSSKENTKEETIYDRVSKLEDEIATLRNEIDVIKKIFGNYNSGSQYFFEPYSSSNLT